jgi:hypothetical protein
MMEILFDGSNLVMWCFFDAFDTPNGIWKQSLDIVMKRLFFFFASLLTIYHSIIVILP